MFGQTGTGKTYTAFGLVERLAAYLHDLEEREVDHEPRDHPGVMAPVGGRDDHQSQSCCASVSGESADSSDHRESSASTASEQDTLSISCTSCIVRCFELAGKKGDDGGFDLLNERARVRLLEDAEGRVRVRRNNKDVGEFVARPGHPADGASASHEHGDHIEGAVESTTDESENKKEAEKSTTGEDDPNTSGTPVLTSLFEKAKKWRLSTCTQRNEASSRSHAVLELEFLGPGAGVLRIVDLAGSERNYETTDHDIERARQGGFVNSSLATLKVG